MRQLWFDSVGARLFAVEDRASRYPAHHGPFRADVVQDLHPAEVSELYAEHIPSCTTAPTSTADIAVAIGEFCDRVYGVERAGA